MLDQPILTWLHMVCLIIQSQHMHSHVKVGMISHSLHNMAVTCKRHNYMYTCALLLHYNSYNDFNFFNSNIYIYILAKYMYMLTEYIQKKGSPL